VLPLDRAGCPADPSGGRPQAVPLRGSGTVGDPLRQ
jgi:hypothetical protein